ncbi:DUF896 domain-containing protein [Listeria grayi]|nr:DUF896 domain-containing protein [Listeria grayi]
MLEKSKIERLNLLARKKKVGTLTLQEKKEQAILREEYLKNFRTHMRGTIENTTVIDPKGNDVTPAKVKALKKKKK